MTYFGPTLHFGFLLDPDLWVTYLDLFGGAERDRTADLLVANEALSQLSYSPSHQALYSGNASVDVLTTGLGEPGHLFHQALNPQFSTVGLLLS